MYTDDVAPTCCARGGGDHQREHAESHMYARAALARACPAAAGVIPCQSDMSTLFNDIGLVRPTTWISFRAWRDDPRGSTSASGPPRA